jgi:hypothetical protein
MDLEIDGYILIAINPEYRRGVDRLSFGLTVDAEDTRHQVLSPGRTPVHYSHAVIGIDQLHQTIIIRHLKIARTGEFISDLYQRSRSFQIISQDRIFIEQVLKTARAFLAVISQTEDLRLLPDVKKGKNGDRKSQNYKSG